MTILNSSCVLFPILLIAFAFLTLSAPWCQAADQAKIFVILSSDISPYRQALEGFNEVMRGKNRPLRPVEHDLAKEGADGIAWEISEARPLLVLAVGPEAAKFAREKVKDVPVIFSMVLRAEAFAGPNATGVSLEIPVRMNLEKIRRILPGARRVGVIYSSGSAAIYREVASACTAMGLQAVGKEIPSGKELHEAFHDIEKKIDLLLMLPDTKIYFPKSIEHLLIDGLKGGVPVVGLSSSYTRAGAVVSFEADYADIGRQAGELALRIIEGEKPSRIAPTSPKRVKTSLNLVVAERLGIKIPSEIVKEASDVFR